MIGYRVIGIDNKSAKKMYYIISLRTGEVLGRCEAEMKYLIKNNIMLFENVSYDAQKNVLFGTEGSLNRLAVFTVKGESIVAERKLVTILGVYSNMVFIINEYGLLSYLPEENLNKYLANHRDIIITNGKLAVRGNTIVLSPLGRSKFRVLDKCDIPNFSANNWL